MRRILPLVLAFALAPAASFAVTVQEIVALSKAGVSEPVILALIERDKTIYALTADQLITLKHEGVTEPIVLAMLRSGRQEPPPPPPAPIVEIPFTEPITEPNIVVHEAERPNADAFNAAPPPAYPAPYLLPYFLPGPAVPSGCVTRIVTPPAATGQFFNGSTAHGQFFNSPSTAPAVGAPPSPQVVSDCAPRRAAPGGRTRHR